ncbi:MAG: hypothetical protein QM647_12415 [Asticcacaulis sp.]|uniref:hypothetical protein n=1 Tax=Asticcacaulis sp. TaxID=1872648 RepID=UPI0039E2A750
MAPLKVSSIAFLSETNDDCRLKTDILEAPVTGAEAIMSTLERMNRFFGAQQIVFEYHDDRRDILICHGSVGDNEPLETITVALRDQSGWISELIVDHDLSFKARKRARAAFGS